MIKLNFLFTYQNDYLHYSLDNAIEHGIITKPPPYSSGRYSTQYYPLIEVEQTIYKHKAKRKYPSMESLAKHFREKVLSDNKLSQRIRKRYK